MKQQKERKGGKDKGQSFVELAVVLTILLLLLAGMVEFGYLLNQYINIVDGAREAARFGVNADPFIRTTSPFGLDQNFFRGLSDLAENTMVPIMLDISARSGYAGDDVVISVISLSGSNVVRFPDNDGWSRYSNAVSAISNGQVAARLDSNAPNTGLVIVEVYYGYPQILKMPFFTAIIPDPIAVHAYSIMPLPAAEPTPTP
jgi:hypothetical protein